LDEKSTLSYYLPMIIKKASKNRPKKLCSDFLNDFFGIYTIMLYARFSPNFRSHFCKMDIFHFSKNVQNQKRPMNLDQPFFRGPYRTIIFIHNQLYIK